MVAKLIPNRTSRPVGAGDAVVGDLVRADRACDRNDADALTAATRALIPVVSHEMSFELVAVAELAQLDLEIAIERWRQLRPRLARVSPRVAA